MSKATEYKKRLAQPLTADVTLPSGAVFTLRRPPLESWLTWGKVPDFLLADAPAMQAAISSGIDAPTDADGSFHVAMAKAAILYAVVDPVLKVGAGPDDDAIDPAEIDEADMAFLFKYVCNEGCPDVPVRTKEGQVSVEALKTFRAEQ